MLTDFPLPRVIAHRGESGLAPENTLAAFSLAAENGATWVELDANISLDKIPYVHHDNALDRCTDGTGNLHQQHSNYLDKLDAGRWFDSAFVGAPLPTLLAVMQLLDKHNMGLNLEIKPVAGNEEATVDAICEVVGNHWPANLPLLISSFNERALHHAVDLAPQATYGYLVERVPDDWQERMARIGCKTLHCHAQSLSESTAAEIKQAGVGLLCYTVNDVPKAQQLWSWGVDSVFTDFPSKLLPAAPVTAVT